MTRLLPDRLKADKMEYSLRCPHCGNPTGFAGGGPSFGDDYEPGIKFDCPSCGTALVIAADTYDNIDWFMELEVDNNPDADEEDA